MDLTGAPGLPAVGDANDLASIANVFLPVGRAWYECIEAQSTIQLHSGTVGNMDSRGRQTLGSCTWRALAVATPLDGA